MVFSKHFLPLVRACHSIPLGGSQIWGAPKLPNYLNMKPTKKILRLLPNRSMTFKSLRKLQHLGRLPIKFWEAPKKILGGSKIWYTWNNTQSIRKGQTKNTLKSQSNNLTFSHSQMFGKRWHTFFCRLLWIQSIWDTGKHNWSIRQSKTKITLKSHNLFFFTLSHVCHKIAYDFLNALVETWNLRYWEEKSEH